ncbi:iduronate 2-sulfatase [Cylas formicarius]|uniref:iduronate 2-sulfatase n=1 Tax=Cylas formicarius TaxID=197179 RepID=UPI00295865BA|nr:iduronate 2-sulfatase [Cylas formicarius]
MENKILKWMVDYFCVSVFVEICSVAQNNVLFIIVDDLKPAIGSFKDKLAVTPNIDKLASKSFVFENAFVQQALCAPSRNSLLTSRRPDSLRLYDFHSYWRTTVGNYTTLPQHFKENGYHTHSIGKVFHPGITSNFSDDFPYSWSQRPFHPKSEIYKNAKLCQNEDGSLGANLICPVIVNFQPFGTLPDIESLHEALHFLKKKNNKTIPYFLAVGFQKPHIPFKFPREYLDLYPLENIPLPQNRWRPATLPEVAWNPWVDIRTRDDMKDLNIPFPYGPISDDALKKIIQCYYASTSYIDYLIGQLLEAVDNNTIIVFVGDHGWSLGEHGELAKYSNFEEATRVPLLIHVPNLTKNKKKITKLVELVDIFPTLVDLTQISKPLSLCPVDNESTALCSEGRSLASAMWGNASKGKSAVFSQYPRPGPYPELNSDKPILKNISIMGYSMTTRRYRYTEWVGFNTSTFNISWNKCYGKELYDHSIDPGENMNLAGRPELHEIQKNLRKKLILGWRHV